MASSTIPCQFFTQKLTVNEDDIASGFSLLPVEIPPVSGYYLAAVSADNITNSFGFAFFQPRYVGSKWRLPVWSAQSSNQLTGSAELLWVKK